MQTNTSLTDKLEQYSNTASGQNTRAKSATEWLGYAAATGASLAMAGTADASIIYSGVQNVTAQINPAAQATTTGFQNINSATFTVGGSQFNALAGFQGNAYSGGNGAKYLGGALVQGTGGAAFLGTSAGYFSGALGASFLAASHAGIGPGGNFLADGAGQFRFNTAGGTGTGQANLITGNFPLGATGIAGVQLAGGNFGWIRLKLEDLGLNQPFTTLLGTPLGDGQNYADKITVIDWAYENSGAPIHAGDTGQTVPEPSSLALLAAGAAGIGAFRRRKAERAIH